MARLKLRHWGDHGKKGRHIAKRLLIGISESRKGSVRTILKLLVNIDGDSVAITFLGVASDIKVGKLKREKCEWVSNKWIREMTKALREGEENDITKSL